MTVIQLFCRRRPVKYYYCSLVVVVVVVVVELSGHYLCVNFETAV